MSRTTAACPRRLGARAAFAALAVAAIAAAPVIALAEATHPANTTISADPSDVDYQYVPDGGGGGGGGG
jgi:anti-sigma-K factor RskA